MAVAPTRKRARRASERLSFFASPAARAQEAYRTLTARYGSVAAEEADAIVVLGGDGTMLQSLQHSLARANAVPLSGTDAVPLYGMNCGKLGFLMNPYAEDDLPLRIARARALNLPPLRMEALSADGTSSMHYAFNEVTLFRRRHFAIRLRVSVDDKVRMEELTCDGAMVATPTGSSAYNYSANGPILPLGSRLLALTPVSAFRPRRWRGAVLPSRARIALEVLDADERPANATADFHEVPLVRHISVSEDRSRSAKILYDPSEHLSERILREQFNV